VQHDYFSMLDQSNSYVAAPVVDAKTP